VIIYGGHKACGHHWATIAVIASGYAAAFDLQLTADMVDENNQDGICMSKRIISQKGQKGPLRMHQDSSQVRVLM
jgi:hypothetical protein